MTRNTAQDQLNTRRKKELAILKAQNEMLEDAKQNILLSNTLENDRKKELAVSITNAQNENLLTGKKIYGATKEEIESAKYGKPSKEDINKYNQRLLRKGITDEQLHIKDITVADGNKELVSYGKKLEKEFEDSVDKQEGIDYESSSFGYINDSSSDNDSDKVVDIPYTDTSDNIANTGIKYVENDNFDISAIPDYVQYDILPLPSNGQCYPSKKSRIPVAYLTASDENLITSPNLYRDGKILDLLLKRKVLDKTVNVDELCKGDRDAIILWLRATGYGFDFPVKVHDPDLDIDYETTIQLDKIKTKKFTLIGDDNGWFDYTANNGDKIKFKYLNRLEEMELQKAARMAAYSQRKQKLATISSDITAEIKDDIFMTDSEKGRINTLAKLVKTWSNRINDDKDYKGYDERMTKSMTLSTMSVNGNTDKEYIKNYIENMRAKDAYDYREYISKHEPGMDFSITINRPESLGGGSFDTFLELNSFIFLSIPRL